MPLSSEVKSSQVECDQVCFSLKSGYVSVRQRLAGLHDALPIRTPGLFTSSHLASVLFEQKTETVTYARYDLNLTIFSSIVNSRLIVHEITFHRSHGYNL